MRLPLKYQGLIWSIAIVGVAFFAGHANAGFGGFRNGAVGGVSINAEGVLSQPTVVAADGLRKAIAADLQDVPELMDSQITLRKISLKKLEAALQNAPNNDLSQLPDEIRYLAGLQRIQYVFVYPEQQDVAIAGPGEGWMANDRGDIVGKTTGLPVIKLEDLLVALQTARTARTSGISCSIDPTEAGTRAMQQYVRKQKQFSPAIVDGIAKSLGPQQITIAGVPETSHFARILVAADYRMKRIAMQLDKSPVPELPSFLEMMAQSRTKITNMMPRWWLACDYDPLARSEDGMSWELRGRGVKVMTEDSLVSDDGSFTTTGKKSPIAARWADQMTRHYDDLSREEAVFGQLRNLMDMSVIAALIEKEQLLQQAGCQLPTLTGANGDFAMEAWNPPKTVSSECSVIKRGREYLITASGGVQIDSWRYAARSQDSKAVGEAKARNAHPADSWWWN